MADYNALGLTFPREPAALDLNGVDWDSVTVVSLQSIPDLDHKSSELICIAKGGDFLANKYAESPKKIQSHSSVCHYSQHFPKPHRGCPDECKRHAKSYGKRYEAVDTDATTCRLFSRCCVACQSNIGLMHDDAILVPCGHQYHIDCLLSLVETSLQTISSFPPRCCRQNIPQDLFDRFLSAAQRTAFASRHAEHDTPKRVYCSNPRCSHFLGPRDKRIPVRILTCPSAGCSTRTCARCKANVEPGLPAHKHECSHDPGHRATLRLGSQLGWVRCPACEELIERHGGCAHMTCVCGAQFCYRCRAVWRTCHCVDWGDGVGADAHEARLFEPLENVGILDAQLELWTPATLEQNGGMNSAGRTGAPEPVIYDEVPAAASHPVWTQAQERRRRSCTLPPNDALRVFKSEATSPPRSSTSLMATERPKGISTANHARSMRSQSFQTVSEVGVCFPFFVDPDIIARGVRAQEARRRRPRALSF